LTLHAPVCTLPYMSTVNVRLQSLRRAAGKSLRNCEQDSGLSNSFLCQIERDEARLLRVGWLTTHQLAEAYAVAYEDLNRWLLEAAKRRGLL